MGNRAKLIYIAGAGHSGSTLLDLLLDNHSQVSGLGEVHQLTVAPYRRVCACGVSVLQCRYWRPRLRRFLTLFSSAYRVGEAEIDEESLPRLTYLKSKGLVRRHVPSLTEILAKLGNQALCEFSTRLSREVNAMVAASRNSWDLYDLVCEMDSTSYVVDSTKNGLRLAYLNMIRPEDTHVIHLVRDGRAVAASAIKRRNITIKQAAREWRVTNRNVEWVLQRCAQSRVLRLRYEDLCDNPRLKLQEIFNWLGLAHEENLAHASKTNRHQIPGNTMLFDKSESRIQKVETWRNRLSGQDLTDFEHVAGRYNRKYGYTG